MRLDDLPESQNTDDRRGDGGGFGGGGGMGGMPIGGGNCRGRFTQFMPQQLRLARQKRVVEHEPHVILDHAQPLTGPIQRGVDDS